MEHVFDEKLVQCLSCGGKIKDYKKDCRDVLISRCDVCSFQFMNPQYEDNYIHQYYVDKYVDDKSQKEHHGRTLFGFDYYVSMLEKYIKPGRMLDIGCGAGTLLHVAAKHGWQIEGYDVDANSTEATSKRLKGAKIHTGDFFALNPEEKYDAITMHQVLEHVKTPNEYLQKIHNMLKDDGILFVAVPNIHSLSNKSKDVLERIGLKRKNIGRYYDTYHHLLYFTPTSLGAMLEKNSFQPLVKRNCHKSKENESALMRGLKINVIERAYANSAFFIVAQKVEE